ncbi:MAG: hypothetical protein K1Y36_19240 [Blastocatellia bacterium]|nr:hypothetical protein [Blastocatellia bacterium]
MNKLWLFLKVLTVVCVFGGGVALAEEPVTSPASRAPLAPHRKTTEPQPTGLPAKSAQPLQPDSETETTKRLADLARLWGTVKYFHPYLAYQNLDWDEALVKAIPQVKAARSRSEYQQALSGLLATLQDPVTTVISDSTVTEVPTTPPPANPPTYYQVVDETVVILVAELVQAQFQGINIYPKVKELQAEIAKAKRVVLDFRYGRVSPQAVPDFAFTNFLTDMVPTFLQGTVPLGTHRYRIHNGLFSQRGSSGSFSSGLMTQVPVMISGRAAASKPLALLIDETTPGAVPLLSGLQAAGVKIVQVGASRKETNVPTFQMTLADNVTVRMRTAEFINQNGSTGFQPDVTVPQASREVIVAAAVQSLKSSSARPETGPRLTVPPVQSLKESAFPEMAFPAEPYRLLALFRFWNAVHYFFPYKDLTDQPWDTVLTEFIPRFENNQNQLEYELTVAEMLARLQDTHGSAAGFKQLDNHLGLFAPPLGLKAPGGKLVVSRIPEANQGEVQGIQIGDVITAIDGESIETRAAYFSRFMALSNQASAYRYIYPKLLRGAKDSKVRLQIQSIEGGQREVELTRTSLIGDISYPPPRETPVFQILPSGFGYVDLARLTDNDFQAALKLAFAAPGIIFDMRGYPVSNAPLEFVTHLTNRKNLTVAQFRHPLLVARDLGDEDFGDSFSFYSFEQKISGSKEPAYRGKVVVLIDENAISASEHFCLMLESAAQVTFIGSPTMGANGDVTYFSLPGGISVRFSGNDVRHADGRQLQRIGIQPQIKVEPTPQGIRENRDEVVEAAVKFLETTLKDQRH